MTTIEQEFIEENIKQYPYPSYDIVLQKIENNMQLWSEYGEPNHRWCKTIYENPNNKELIVDIGKQIYKSGGLQALIMNYNVIKYFNPDYQNKNIKEYFKEVCSEWYMK